MKKSVVLVGLVVTFLGACGGGSSPAAEPASRETTGSESSGARVAAGGTGSLTLTGNVFDGTTATGSITSGWPDSMIEMTEHYVTVRFETPAGFRLAYFGLPTLAPGTYVQNPEAETDPVSCGFGVPSTTIEGATQTYAIFDATIVVEALDTTTGHVRFHYEGNTSNTEGGPIHVVADVDGVIEVYTPEG